MKSLVAYYSRTNITKRLAENIAELIDAETEEITPKVNYQGKIGFVKGGKDALSEKIIELEPLKHDPSEFDVIYLGCPVWAGKAANPLVSYMKQNEGKLTNVKFFLTAMSNEFDKAFDQMENYSAKPTSTLGLTTKEVKANEYQDKLSAFIG